MGPGWRSSSVWNAGTAGKACCLGSKAVTDDGLECGGGFWWYSKCVSIATSLTLFEVHVTSFFSSCLLNLFTEMVSFFFLSFSYCPFLLLLFFLSFFLKKKPLPFPVLCPFMSFWFLIFFCWYSPSFLPEVAYVCIKCTWYHLLKYILQHGWN